MKTDAKAKKGGLIKRFMPYYKRHLGTLSFDLFCAALTTLCELALPIIVREITGTATNNPENLTLKFILTLGAIYIVLKGAVSLQSTYKMLSPIIICRQSVI